MTAPLWQASPDADTGSTNKLSLTITAPSSGVSTSDQVFLLVNGVTAAPTSVTVSGTGISQTTIVPLTTAVNEWWAAYVLTGLSNNSVITVANNVGKLYDVMMVGYAGSGIGNVSALYSRPASSFTTTLPAFTAQNAASTVVDLWAERNTTGTTVVAVSTGTVRRQFRGTGTTTTSIAISDYEPGTTSVGSVVGTYTDGAGTNRSSTNGAGIQVELLSGAPPPPAPILTSIVAGGVTTTSAKVRIDASGVLTAAKAIAATDTGFTTGVVESSGSLPDSDGLTIETLTGLAPGTNYFYGVRLDGTVYPARGTFRTAFSGAHSFSFLAASCVNTPADPAVLDAMRTRTGPAGRTAEFFAHLGDFEYTNTSSASASAYLTVFRAVVAKARHKTFFNAIPLEYTVSDHDGWGDNCDAASAGAGVVAAWRSAYSRYFATYDTPAVNTDGAPYRSWVRGRIRFIMTDGRTYMDAIAATDNASKSKLGATQKQWVKDEVLAAKNAGQIVVVFFEDGGWNAGSTFTGDDTWARYTTERTELVNYWTSIGMNSRMMIIHGDFHALAADDGTNSPGGIPMACASPIQQTYYMPSQDHWSEGVYPASNPGTTLNHYGWFDVTDSGSSLSLAFTGYSNDGTTDTARITLSTTWAMTAVPNNVTVWNGTTELPTTVTVWDGAAENPVDGPATVN